MLVTCVIIHVASRGKHQLSSLGLVQCKKGAHDSAILPGGTARMALRLVLLLHLPPRDKPLVLLHYGNFCCMSLRNQFVAVDTSSLAGSILESLQSGQVPLHVPLQMSVK